MHRLLKNQISRFFGGIENMPQGAAKFAQAVDETYASLERDALLAREAPPSLPCLPDNFPDSYLLIEPDGLIREHRLGLPERHDFGGVSRQGERIEATPFWKIPEFAESWQKSAQTLVAQGFEHSLLGERGRRYLEFRFAALKSGRVLTLYRDITQRKQDEDSLQQAKKLYRDIFENTLVGIYLTSQDGRFVNANPSMARILGFATPEELVDTYTDLSRDMYVDPKRRDELLRLLDSEGSVPDFECQAKRKDGSHIWIAINARALRDENGKLAYIEGTVEDSTQRRLAEEAKLRYSALLEERVGERTAELTAANSRLKREIEKRKIILKRYKSAKEAAESASRAKSEFLSIVSHELRTPLTSVLGFAKIIRKKLAQNIFPTLKTCGMASEDIATVLGNIDIVVSEGQRLTNLINDLLDIAKLEAGKIELRKEPVNLGELTEQAWQAVAPLAGEKGLFFMSEISALGGVYCDRERILQVFINLFSNAIKFTPAGSITCVIKPENAQALVCVSDTGIGIDLENQEMIFEKFIQARDALTDKPKGTGLGLAICRKIIHHHGGIIWVESQPGQGSSFCFTLPLTPNHPEATQP